MLYCSVDLKHFFDDMRAVMEYWLRLDKLSALPPQPSNNQIRTALAGCATADQLDPFIASRLSDSRARGGSIRNIGAHHFVPEVTVGHPEAFTVPELVCMDLEELEGQKEGVAKLLSIRVNNTYREVKDALVVANIL